MFIAYTAELAAAQAFGLGVRMDSDEEWSDSDEEWWNDDAGMELGTAQLPTNVYNAAMKSYSFAKVKRNARMSSALVSCLWMPCDLAADLTWPLLLSPSFLLPLFLQARPEDFAERKIVRVRQGGPPRPPPLVLPQQAPGQYPLQMGMQPQANAYDVRWLGML